MEIKSDIEIAQSCEMKNIREIAATAGVDEKYLEMYGNYKAKVDYKLLRTRPSAQDGKLILVTAITPTPAGEGKTTTSVGSGGRPAEAGQEVPWSPCVSPPWALCSASRAVRPAAAGPRWCPWRTSTSTSPATSTPSARRTT